jgi:RNA-directed DNA polymerase
VPSSILGQMSLDLLLPKDLLDYLIRSAPYRYKVYQIPKRTGRGVRTIAQPAKEVKRLQYWVMRNVFPLLSVHPSATAYVTKKNIRQNTEPHASYPYLLKLDFKDFFPSIRDQDFIHLANENNNFEVGETDLDRLVRILFWRPKSQRQLILSIGAPSSPYLSNAMMYRFDNEIATYCEELDIAYTRYADDITFSMHKKELRGNALQKVLEILDQLPFPRLQINARKTVFGSKAHRRMVTGLILSNEGDVSLGRQRKRNIRAQIHWFVVGKLSDLERPRLRGMLAFARDIEPEFIVRMEQKYGAEVLGRI